MRYLSIAVFVAFIFLISCRMNNQDKSHQNVPRVFENLNLYTFSSDDLNCLGKAQPFVLPPNASLRDALNSLGRHLAEKYFSTTYANEPTNIHFEVVGIDRISTPSRTLVTATVNMIDVNDAALGFFFQGSTGGQTTFCMLAATFMQPHLDPPLLDGLILLHNGKLLPQLDHINLSGLLIPRLVRHAVKRAIYSTEMKAVSATHSWQSELKFML